MTASLRERQVESTAKMDQLKVMNNTVDMERFAGLNIHSVSPMKFFAEILSQCIGHQRLLLTYN